MQRKRTSFRTAGRREIPKYVRRLKSDDPDVRFFQEEIEAYRQRFLPLIKAEQDVEEKVVYERLASWSEDTLKKEGYCLTGLHGFWLDHTILGRVVARFRGEIGTNLPTNQFSVGTQILLSRLDPLKEQPYKGNVVKSSLEQIDVSFEDTFGVEDGLWRLDAASSNIVYERMRDAISTLSFDPAMHEIHPDNSSNSEVVLQGTQLRDVLLRSFSPQPQISHAPHHLQEPSDTQYVDHDVLEHPSQLADNRDGAFAGDMRIQSWASRYMKSNPVVVEGDPVIKDLNHTQVRASAMMIGEQISLIQGPPGTGKTQTIIETVKLLKGYFEVPHPILVCTYTNGAADKLLENFMTSGLKPLRVGFEGSVRADLHDYTLEKHFNRHPLAKDHEELLKRVQATDTEFREHQRLMTETEREVQSKPTLRARYENMKLHLISLQDRLKMQKTKSYKLKQIILRDIVMQADVICTTCITSASYALKVVDFPVIFLDEASMSTEPASLIPLMKGCRHLALIGDHKQLPPVIISREARDGGLGISLFERLAEERKVPSIMLDIQYRMHPDISHFPSKEFYDLALRDGTVSSTGHVVPTLLPPISGHLSLNPESEARPPIFFLDHQGPETLKNRSRVNYTEAYTVCAIIEDLLLRNPELHGEDIGVISPYKSQISLLNRLLTKTEKMRLHFRAILGDRAGQLGNVEVRTVDGFEGREKDAIIFSTVRNNTAGHIGFLADRRRLNVGLTRAKRALYVIGSISTLEKGRYGRQASNELNQEDLSTVCKGAQAWRSYAEYLAKQNLVRRLDERKLRSWLAQVESRAQRL